MISGLVLAAGAGRRFGQPKAELVVRGERLIDTAVALLRAGGCDAVLAVVRSAEVTAAGARTAVNPSPDEGMGSSLRVGLSAVDADACVIMLVDQVGITPADIAAVISEYRSGSTIVVARRSGQRSHPVLVSRAWYDEFGQAAVGDQGARAFIDHRPDVVRFVDLSGQIIDIDTPVDLPLDDPLG
jgi:CTP:molybdopterin cytidylyltransferase MocA